MGIHKNKGLGMSLLNITLCFGLSFHLHLDIYSMALRGCQAIISEKPLAPPCWRRFAFHPGNVTTVHCNRKKTAGALLLKEKTFCGTPLVAGTHGPTMLVAVCKTRLEPESGYKITTCPPADAMLTGGILLPDEPVISLRQTGAEFVTFSLFHCPIKMR
jgi:hypothetical protein